MGGEVEGAAVSGGGSGSSSDRAGRQHVGVGRSGRAGPFCQGHGLPSLHSSIGSVSALRPAAAGPSSSSSQPPPEAHLPVVLVPVCTTVTPPFWPAATWRDRSSTCCGSILGEVRSGG